MSIFTIPVHPDHVRTFKDPNHPKIRIVHALVNVSDLPENIPLDPDPRVPKVKSNVTKKISDSLKTDDGRFHLLNRGITLSVKSVEFDNKRGILTLNIPEGDVYGIIDGGHTYDALTTVVNSLRNENADSDDIENSILPKQYVHIEVLEGTEGHLADIAEARNYSIPLKDWTLARYRGKFDWFLNALGDDYQKYIKDNENDEKKPVGILDLVQVMCAMNPTLFPQSKPPVDAYNSTGKCLGYFTAEYDPHGFRKLDDVCRDIVQLNDYVRSNWKAKYNAVDESDKHGRLGKRIEVTKRKRNRTALATYYFLDPTNGPVQGDVPIEKGLSIPVLSSLRALLEEHDGKFRWAINPRTFFDEHGTELVKIVMDASKDKGGDPHSVGRDPQMYNYLYLVVKVAAMKDRM